VQLWCFEFLKFQYKIQSNFENIDFQKLSPFQFESLIQNLFGILKSDQNESCRARQNEQLLFWEFFKLLRKIKSNFGISILPQFKSVLPPNWNFEFQTVWFKFVPFLSKLALDP